MSKLIAPIYVESPESERLYRKLVRLSKELHIPMPYGFLELKATMPDGRITHWSKQRSHSWCRNAYNQLFAVSGWRKDGSAWGDGDLTGKKTSGATVAILNAALSTRASSGVDTYGILIGTGTTAHSFDDYDVETQIVDGTGTGEMSHVAYEDEELTWVSGTRTLTITLARYFNNNSGGSISVTESAVVGSYSGSYYLMARDVFTAVPVGDTGQFKVVYTNAIVYPS